MAPDSLDVGFGEQSFHLILKFLAYQVVFQDRDDQEFPEFWHGMASENPTVNNLRTGNQWRGQHSKNAECNKQDARSDSVRAGAPADRHAFR